jgi:Flp pilus assembly protein TadD
VTGVLLTSDQAEEELVRARALKDSGKKRAAQAAIAAWRACALDPSNEDAAALLAELTAREGFRFQSAGGQKLVAMRLALDDDPENVDLLVRVANAYRQEGEILTATTFAKRAARKAPDDARAHAALHWLCGDEDGAFPYGTGLGA